MGFHVCAYCKKATSSRDYAFSFDSGRIWEMPAMIIHYIRDHRFLPPQDFIDDVLDATLVGMPVYRQTKGLNQPQEPVKVGYLCGEYPTGSVPPTLVSELEKLIEQAVGSGNYAQTRGLRR